MSINDVIVLITVVTFTLALSTTVVTASCGVQAIPPSTSLPGTAIVGGAPATPHSWPWAAQLKFQGNHYCAATLIHPKWVVTAAHCTQEIWVGFSKVHLGSHSRDQIDVGKEVQIGTLQLTIPYLTKWLSR
uniref:Plasminogen-like n=1 Tax=Saccoglossus kowalevskii TaxID=10224 RepID=A0ABM0MZQ9_SACKO|nr:PREDICTED: plasminogen-like [Saccoglossus kowalevskii]